MGMWRLCVLGPPPRAWGQPRLPGDRSPGRRSTPTSVGTTDARTIDNKACTVHPHERGDNAIVLSLKVGSFEFHPHERGDNAPTRMSRQPTVGPPPRAWGQRGPCPASQCRRRSTPTSVGTTSLSHPRRASFAVHPHERGDNEARVDCEPDVYGPPPRAWGQRMIFAVPETVSRSTPTSVGTTPSTSLTGATLTVHPHERGDNFGK